MANRRMLSSDIFEDDFFISLTMFERMVWIGMVVRCADDQGRLQDRSILIKSQIFPADVVAPGEIEIAMEKFAEAGKVTRYKAGDKSLIQITNWWKYQTPQWAAKSKYPAPVGWVDREKYHAAGGKVITMNWDNPGGYSQVTSLDTNHVGNQDTNPDASGIEDVKGNGNGDGDCNGEGEVETAQAATAADAPPVFCGPSTLEEGRKIQGRIRMAYSALIGKVTPLLETDISEAIYKYPEDWIMDSIQIAARKGVKTWAYIRGILNKKAEAAQGAITAADYAAFVER